MLAMSEDELKNAALLVLAAAKHVEPGPGEHCQHCDLDVGWVCPLCGLTENATDLARYVLYGRTSKDATPASPGDKKNLAEVESMLRNISQRCGQAATIEWAKAGGPSRGIPPTTDNKAFIEIESMLQGISQRCGQAATIEWAKTEIDRVANLLRTWQQ